MPEGCISGITSRDLRMRETGGRAVTAASSRDRARLDHALDPEGPDRLGGLAWAEMVLRDQEMPPDELRVVLTTPDRELVRHHLELHLERLEERLSTQRRRVAAVERIVAEAIERPSPTRARPRGRDPAVRICLSQWSQSPLE
jgi:hypothetical protein